MREARFAMAVALVWLLPQLLLAQQIGLPGCPTSCGDVSVPYPFGIAPGCFLHGLNLTCDRSHTPPRLLLGDGTLQVTDISLDDDTVSALGPDIRTATGGDGSPRGYVLNGTWGGGGWGLRDGDGPYLLAEERNELVLLGCFLLAQLLVGGSTGATLNSCSSVCWDDAPSKTEGYCSGGRCRRCSGVNCCRVPIPVGYASYHVLLSAVHQWFDPATHANPRSVFISEEGWFTTGYNNYSVPPSWAIPVVLSWRVVSNAVPRFMETRDGNATCPRDVGSAATCHSSYSTCTNLNNRYGNGTDRYYTCKCWDGYQGNPYLVDGCQDINECELPSTRCYGTCTNKPGTYVCECPQGTSGDPSIPHGCIQLYAPHPGLSIGLGVGSGALLIILVLTNIPPSCRSSSVNFLEREIEDCS